MNLIIIIALAVGTMLSIFCGMYCVVYCFAHLKYKNIKPFVVINPTLKDVTETREFTLSYYK